MRRCAWRCAVLFLVLCGLSGCLMDANLDANGGGTMTIKYRLTNASQLEASKKRMQSSAVKVVTAQVDPAKWATFVIKFDDITKLSTTEFFSRATFRLTDENGVKTLNVKYLNPDAAEMPDDMIAYFGKDVTLSVHVPGPIVESNATTTEGNAATWKYTMKDFSSPKEVALSVRYKVEPGAAGAGAGAAGGKAAAPGAEGGAPKAAQ
jgi:hypothetical protein